MQSAEKPKGGRNKQPASKSKGDGGASAERSVHTFVAGLSDSNRVQHRGTFLFILQSLVGSDILIRTRDGGEIRGIFNTATPFDTSRGTEVVVKMALVKGGKKSIEKGSTVVVSIDDIVALEATGIDLKSSKDAAVSGDLQTDGDIGKSTKLGAAELQNLQGRDLASVDSNWLSSDAIGSLESGKPKKGNGNASWDQFEVNKRLYNVNSTYDENLYTKPLNRNELTRDQIKKAEKYAKEIEGTRSSNIHLQEERGQVMERDMDEEDLYSGVLRPAAAPSSTAKTPKATSASSSGGSWRRAVTGEPSSPTTVPAVAAPSGLSKGNKPSPVAAGNAKNTKNTGKAKAVPGRVAPPPGYDDDYIPVTSTKDGARKSPPAAVSTTASRSQESDASSGEGKTEKRAASPEISFFAVPEEKAAPIADKAADAPKTEEKEPASADVPAEKKDTASAADLAASSKLNVNAKEFKFNVNAKEFVFTPKAATTPAPAPPAAQSGNAGGKQHGGNRRFDNHGYQNQGYPDNGYGVPPAGMQQWGHGGGMMYNNGGMMMNGPIVPPVGEMPVMGGYPLYPEMGYGGAPMIGPGPGQMYPNAPPMHMGPGGYDISYGGAGSHMGGRGGGRGGYGRGGRGNYNAGQQGDGAARGRTSSHSSANPDA